VSAIKIAGVGGTVVAAGFYQGPATPLVLGEEFLHNRVTLKASMGVWDCPLRYPRWDRPRLVREAYWLIESGRLNLQGFLTATFDFGDAAKAYEAIRSEPSKYLKVALSYA
jgi:threonine dehydrogenase-like Zn-dependent dehydrogenase